jgi:DNA-binding IclR family transcriptional regulator
MATNQSLERGLALLDLLDGHPAQLGIREMARTLALSPAIIQRLANTLVRAGYVEQVPETRRYRLGYRSLLLGAAMRRDDRLLATASGELQRLADDHRLNGYLGVLRDGNVIYLHCAQSSGPIAVRIMPGARCNPHSTAMGKALLAELPPEGVALVVGAPPYERFTANTITEPAPLAEELATIRQQGFAFAREENLPGVISIGTVIRDMSGKVVAAMSVAFLSSERGEAEWPRITQMILDAAHRCSQSLGHPGTVSRAPEPKLDAA